MRRAMRGRTGRGRWSAVARITAVTAWTLAYSAMSAHGQTNDHFYRSWRWSTTPGSARAVGLAGAYVAMADDGGGAFLNPAGIVTLDKSEVSLNLLAAQSGTVGVDAFGPWTGLAAAGGSARVSKKTAIAGYFVRPRAGRIDLSTAVRLPDGSTDAGYLNSILTDVGAAVARRVGERLSIGVRVTATHLELEALHRRSAGERIELETGSASGDTRVTASLGLLYEAGTAGRLRLGAVVQPGASYTVERTASRPSQGGIDQGSLYELRAPGIVTVGAAFRVSRRLQLSSQVDYVRYSEIEAFVRPGGAPAGGYTIPDGVEPRFGIEASFALGRASVQLRGGVHLQAPGSFLYSGPDPNEAAIFRGSTRRVVGAVGASLLSAGGFAVDIAGATGGDRSEVVAGARFRF